MIEPNTRGSSYVLKHKDEVFDCFLRWKAFVDKSSGRKVKAIRTENGRDYRYVYEVSKIIWSQKASVMNALYKKHQSKTVLPNELKSQ